jgi:hypothetical protein
MAFEGVIRRPVYVQTARPLCGLEAQRLALGFCDGR